MIKRVGGVEEGRKPRWAIVAAVALPAREAEKAPKSSSVQSVR